MNLLLIETSSKIIEFSYWKDGRFIIKEKLPPEMNADMLIYCMKKTFNAKKIQLRDIDFVSLSNGPGSFTGLRIGSAIAKGICYCTDSKLIEISTLDIIANKYTGGDKFIALIFSNMRSAEFYFGEYEKNDGKLFRKSEYKTGKLTNFLKDGYDLVINENIDAFIEKNNLSISDLSNISNFDSHLELTLEYIKRVEVSNFNTSEPFYMNDFIPKT